MDKITLHLKADEQILTSAECPFKLASNTVSYVEAVFELGENWTGYDSVRAVWTTYLDTIATVLDSEGKCVVPHEVLTRTGKVSVNLVGSIVEDEELTDRLTTYPTVALNVNADAYVEGTETAPVTPSQFEQYVADVAEEVAKIKDIESTTLNDDYTLTFVFSDGTSTTVGPIRGEQGEQGIQGIQGPPGPPGEVTMAQFESAFPTDTASGAIASFPDGTDLFGAKSLVVEINPIQDLHGYDSPWVGGGGKNKLDLSKFTAGITAFGLTSAISGEYIAFSGTCSSGGSHAWRFMGTTDATTQALMATLSFKGFVISGTAPTIENIYWGSGNNQLSISVSGLVTNQSYNFTIGIVGYSDGTAPTQWTPYSNICPISGWGSVGATRTGKNLFDKSTVTVGKWLSTTTGLEEPVTGYDVSDYIPVEAGKSVFIARSGSARRWFYDKNKNPKTYLSQSQDQTFTPTEDGFIRVTLLIQGTGQVDIDEYQIELGTTATTYEAYNGTTKTVTLPTTTYGGSVDLVSGVLKGNLGIKTFDGTENGWEWPSSRPMYRLTDMKEGDSLSGLADWLPTVSDFNSFGIRFGYGNKYIYVCQPTNIPSVTDLATFKTYLGTHNLTIVYPLDTPTTTQLTPQQISILKATNNIFADSGNVSVTYKADTQLWVEKKLSEL